MTTVTGSFEGEIIFVEEFAVAGDAQEFAATAWVDAAYDPDSGEITKSFIEMADAFLAGETEGTIEGFSIVIR